ncbi:hypothetical protein LINPERPRIM_LOCUS42100, partial [Linum perenne]
NTAAAAARPPQPNRCRHTTSRPAAARPPQPSPCPLQLRPIPPRHRCFSMNLKKIASFLETVVCS